MKETAVDCCRLVIEEGVKVIVTFDYKVKDKEDVSYVSIPFKKSNNCLIIPSARLYT